MIYNKQQRDAAILEKYQEAAPHLKGRAVAQIQEASGLCKAQVYNIINKSKD